MNKNMIILTEEELENNKPGEAITVAAVMACLVASIVAVIIYKLFISGTGNVTIPGGFKFTWK